EYFALLIVLVSAAIFTSVAEAADQGKLGKSSSASVEISVTVNQTLRSVSPDELILSNNLTTKSTEPFCVTHHGYNKHANVPYDLIVDNIKTANNQSDNQVMPFNVYLVDQKKRNSKQHLTRGVSISTQSNLSISKNTQSACANSGLQLTIEENDLEDNTSDTNSVGIMVLLLSPT
ncbi:MAG: hypothetical protein AAF304_05345, partial [Pseudomonadota bacterium]